MYFTGMNYSSSQQLQEMTSLVTWDLYSIVNDPQSQMIPKNGPEMILDRN